MIKVTKKVFENLVADAIDAIPPQYLRHLQNVAFIVEDEPNRAQQKQLGLACNDLLFGLYEGVPLPQRSGTTKLLPDKITLFKHPLEAISSNSAQLKEHIRHTVWHEVAHYYGLNHERIHELENKKPDD